MTPTVYQIKLRGYLDDDFAAAVACSGLGYAVQIPTFDTSNASFGKENPVNQKILVIYATRAGSTVEIAKAIGHQFRQK